MDHVVPSPLRGLFRMHDSASPLTSKHGCGPILTHRCCEGDFETSDPHRADGPAHGSPVIA